MPVSFFKSRKPAAVQTPPPSRPPSPPSPLGAVWHGDHHGHALNPDRSPNPAATAKYTDELAFWRESILNPDRAAAAAFLTQFAAWQAARLNELADRLDLDRGDAMNNWCRSRTVIEIGGGPFPSSLMRPFRASLAVDPLADGYVSSGLYAHVLDHLAAHSPATALPPLTHIVACGEHIPIASAAADLVIIENALDHTDRPDMVIDEARRLLKPGGNEGGGLLWLLVDLMDHSDHMHPSPMSIEKLDTLLLSRGFSYKYKVDWEGASHPMAKRQVRILVQASPSSQRS